MEQFFEFLASYAGETGLTFLIVAILLVVGYELRLISFKKQASKYDFASMYEVRFLKSASTFFSIALTFLLFDFITRVITNIKVYEYYFVAFVSLGVGMMFYYGLSTYFKVYYPFILEKKLSRIRFKPRKSPKTGKPMKLLNELEEDTHMTQEMIEHEDSFTYDYDVWLDEETGFKMIERYDGHLHSLICPNCNFRTLKDYKESVIKTPTLSEKGFLQKHYKCSYCSHEDIKQVTIASLGEEKKLTS